MAIEKKGPSKTAYKFVKPIAEELKVPFTSKGPEDWLVWSLWTWEESGIGSSFDDWQGMFDFEGFRQWWTEACNKAGLDRKKRLEFYGLAEGTFTGIKQDFEVSRLMTNAKSPIRKAIRAELGCLESAIRIINTSPFIESSFRREARKHFDRHRAGVDLLFKITAEGYRTKAKAEGLQLGKSRGIYGSKQVDKAIVTLYKYLKKNVSGLNSIGKRCAFIADLLSNVYRRYSKITLTCPQLLYHGSC